MTIAHRLTTSSADASEEKFGFILMLDALGVSSFNHFDQRKWLENRDRMLHHLAEQQAWYLKNSEAEYEMACAEIKRLGLPLECLSGMNDAIALYHEIQTNSDFASFGDTIVFHSWCSERYESYEYSLALIAAIGLSLHEVMKANIKFGLKLRGALSLGKYFKSSDGNTILGSALIDAYNYYEAADWIGIVMAPGLIERHMDEAASVAMKAIEKFGVPNTEQFFRNPSLSYRERLAISNCAILHRYNVPFTKGEQRSLWVPSWPLTIFLDKITGSALNSLGINDFENALPMMQGVKRERDSAQPKHRLKYENTIAFFEEIWARARMNSTDAIRAS